MSTESRHRFKDVLRERLSKRGTAKNISIDTGIPETTISYWKNDETAMPNAEEVFDIAQSLGVSVEYLVTGENPPDYRADPTGAVDFILELPEEERRRALAILKAAFPGPCPRGRENVS